MKVGIIGRTGTGRTTLFGALTGQNDPGHAGKTRLGLARVRDPRVDELSAICKPKKTVYAEVTLALPHTSFGSALDLSGIRELRDLWAYVHVVGAFNVPNAEATMLQQLQEVQSEMLLSDMDRIEKRLARIKKGGIQRAGEAEVLAEAQALLEAEKPLRVREWGDENELLFRELGLLSQRPLLTVVNVDEGKINDPIPPAVEAAATADGGEVLWLCAPLEAEIAALEEPEAQREFLAEYGMDAPVGQRFTQSALRLLKQMSFFTVGPDEVRAWTVPIGSLAPRAARAIHSDLEKGFIRAEVIDYDLFVEVKSEAQIRKLGKIRVEGREYVVKDGEIISIRFNV